MVFANYNNALAGPGDNHNQILLVKSTDGGSFSKPVKVATSTTCRLRDLPGRQEPVPELRPGKGPTSNSYFRAANYPSGQADPTDPSPVAVTYGSYINPHSNESNGCAPQGFSRPRSYRSTTA